MNSVSAPSVLEFAPVDNKPIYAAFDGGNVSSDAGLLLLKQAESNLGVVKAITACIDDKRDQRYIDHSYESLSAQRVFQIAAGYEDANDCTALRVYSPSFDDSL